MFDPRLISKLNRGRCFALVGSGPSTEMGYNTWRELAVATYEALSKAGKVSDKDSYTKYLAENKYPELFRQAERDLGNRTTFVQLVKSLLRVKTPRQPAIYNILAGWPVACYLTTNYDDEISAGLKRLKVYYKDLGNTKTDLALLRHDATGFIVKLHSDFNHPNDIVLTSYDYQRLSTSPAGEYYRAKMRSIFEMFDVFIIGHSLTDPDLALILQIAKETASPQHPTYLIAADITKAEEQELFEKFNIVAIPYRNPDGKHARLKRMLSSADKFVIPRLKRMDVEYVPPPQEEIEAAQSLMIYRQVHKLADANAATPGQYLGPLILQALLNAPSAGVSESELVGRAPLSVAVQNDEIRSLVMPAIQELTAALLVNGIDRYGLTETGHERVSDLASRKSAEEEKAFGQFLLTFNGLSDRVSKSQERRAVALLKDTLVHVFRQRGLSIANAVFAKQSIDPDDLSNIFSAISAAAGQLADDDLGASFLEAAEAFILEPTEPQLLYLTSLSQGFFLYHLLGLDPKCATTRRDVLARTLWWSDASIIIPLLARGSGNYEYSRDLFRRLAATKATVVTTTKFLREVFNHLAWAERLFQTESIDSAAFLEAALMKGSYKQNLFLDGYIRWAAEGRVGTYKDYLSVVAPGGVSVDSIKKELTAHGITVIDVHDLEGYETGHLGDVNDLKELVRLERQRRDNYRNELQVEAEAEVLHVIRSLRAAKYKPPNGLSAVERTYFLSQSLVLDRVHGKDDAITWTPEALYRYLLALPGEELHPALLHQCMLQDYYASGVVLFDRPRYLKFFGPAVTAARVSFATEKEKYLKEFSQVSAVTLDETFERTPDLEKPFFISQMAWKVVRTAEARAEHAKLRAEAAEAELKLLRTQRDSNWKRKQTARERQVEAELRQQKDPKHLKKKQKQAKQRLKKKKKH